MTWVKAEFDFDSCTVEFRLGYKSRLLLKCINELGDKPEPDRIEAMFREALVEARPELAQATILAVQFDISTKQFRMFATHPSLKGIGDPVELYPDCDPGSDKPTWRERPALL